MTHRTHRAELAILAVLALLAAVALASCAGSYQVHPGAVNVFDSQAYDSLLVAHATIESTKADLAGNVFTASLVPAIKKALNDLIAGYNVADAAYQAYHTAAVAGTATTAQANAVTDGLASVSTGLSNLSAAKGVTK